MIIYRLFDNSILLE